MSSSYHYEPRFIELTSDEHKMWKKLSAKIAAASQNEDALMAAAGKRNRVMQHADHKLSELKKILETDLVGENLMFIYSPEGWDPDDAENDEENRRGIEKIRDIMEEKGYKVALYDGSASTTKRKALQTSLKNEEIDALISMKCLDQGIDVPQQNSYIPCLNKKLATVRAKKRKNPRKYPGKLHAKIFDMLVKPPRTDGNEITVSDKNLLIRELKRGGEPAYAAQNKFEALTQIRAIAAEYQLNIHDVPWLDGESPTNQ